MARKWTASQEAAISLSGKTLLVSAAAGSGKTSVLTERIIRSLLDTEHPADLSRMLVVTFTRAAAAELKSRIAASLTEALAERPSDKHLSRQLLLLGSAQISTIDSFFQRLVRANFEQLGLPATFRIADASETMPLCMELMDSLISEFYDRYDGGSSGTSPFARIENNRFAEALDHLLSNRSDGKLNGVLLDYLEKFSSYPEGIELLHTSSENLLRGADGDFFASVYGETVALYLEGLFGDYEATLLELQESLSHDADGMLKCGGLLESDLTYCREMLLSLEKRSYSAAQRTAQSFIGGRFPTVKNKSDAVIAYQDFRTVFRKSIAGDVQEKLAFPAEVISLQMRKTAELLEILYQFYKEYQMRLMAEKNLRGILEHNDVRAMLYRLLTNKDGTASDLARSVASQYDAVYIDEYQDVDLLQDTIFAMIGGNRRFMVGDIKQSIYGFRGSDPSIFASYRRSMPLHTETGAENSDGVCVFMSENFRCDPPVIDFANRVCSFLFSACEKSVGYRKQDDLVCSKTPAEPAVDGYPFAVQVAVFDRQKSGEYADADVDGNQEAVWVAAEISKLLRTQRLDNGQPVTPSDIAILVRNRAHGRAFVKALETLNIPVSAENSADLLQDPILIDLLNLLRAVDNPYRDIPLSEFLISPLGGFSLEELSCLRAAAPDSKALYDALEMGCEADLSEALQCKTRTVLDWLARLRENASILPADRFLRLLYLEERILPYAELPSLRFLYDQSRIYQRSSWCGLFGFLKHFQRVIDGKKVSAAGLSKAESAVTVMTVHHSKGLEFPVVFLAATGATFNRSDSYEGLLFHKNVGGASKLYDPVSGEKQTTVLREAVRQVIDDEQTEESIRTLYVALTRARERLYVSGTLGGKWENALAASSMVCRGQRAAILGCNSYLAWILAALQEKNVESTAFFCDLRHYAVGEVERGVALSDDQKTVDSAEGTLPQCFDDATLRYARIMQEQASLPCLPNFLQGIPTKAAASKLRGDLLDVLRNGENEKAALQLQLSLMESATPSFERLLSERDQPSATDVGTATHAFLQYCDFERLQRFGVDAECDRLVSQAFITTESARIINRNQLEAFCKSELMRWISDAVMLRREQKFSLFVPLSQLTRDQSLAEQLDGHSLFVQGSIDLLIENDNGELILIDYKTDRITDEERADRKLLTAHMRERHGEQLACYATAVERMLGRTPDRIYLYSLPLGEAILLN